MARSRHKSARPKATQGSSQSAPVRSASVAAGTDVAAAPAFEPLIPPRWLRLPAWLGPGHDPLAGRMFWLLLALVWVGGVALRLLFWARVGSGVPDFQVNGAPLMTTGDGYFWALGSNIALSGDDYGLLRYPPAADNAIVCLGWLATKLTPWSLDQVIFYLPALVGPLIALPVALIARGLIGARGAILAAALAVVAPRFAGRTIGGYFDTDMFSVTVPLVAAWLLIRLVREGRARDGLVAAMVLAALPFFYDQGGPVGAAIAVAAVFVLVVWHRKDAFFAPSIAVLGLSQLPLPWAVRTALLVPAWFALRRAPVPPRILYWVGVAAGLVGFALSDEWASAMAKVGIFTGAGAGGTVTGPGSPDNVVLGDTTRFVAEAKRSGVDMLALSLSGSMVTFVLGTIGWAALQLRHRALLILAPLFALGLFSLVGGVRFGIFGVAPAAIGLAWLAVRLATLVRRPPVARTLALVVLGIGALLPAVLIDYDNPAPPQTLAGEAQALDALGKVVKPGDLVVTWWDYGYPIAYYAHAKTLADGGSRGEDSAISAEVLVSNSQRGAAILARLAAETQLRVGHGIVARELFKEAKAKFGLGQIDFIHALTYPMYPLPEKTHDVYLYLPTRMVGILGPISVSRPIEVGREAKPLRVAVAVNARALPNPDHIELGNGVVVDPDAVVVKNARGARPLRALYVVSGAGPTFRRQMRRNPTAPVDATSGIYVEDQAVFYELDEALMSSVYVQLALLENADPNVYELVYANELAHIYRLKL